MTIKAIIVTPTGHQQAIGTFYMRDLSERDHSPEQCLQDWRDDTASYISDGYKDAHGIRPRWLDYDAMSNEELNATADSVSRDVRESIEREKEDDANAIAEFKTLIQETIAMGAGDKETAVRWLYEAVQRDWGYNEFTFEERNEHVDSTFCYEYFLPYDYDFRAAA